jgi:predicted RNase H-like HicB family nuclease
MQYVVQIEENDEGFSVSCPGLPGCWSQGKTRKEALANIKDAIATYLETIKDLTQNKDTQIIEVAI